MNSLDPAPSTVPVRTQGLSMSQPPITFDAYQQAIIDRVFWRDSGAGPRRNW